jgi:cyclase
MAFIIWRWEDTMKKKIAALVILASAWLPLAGPARAQQAIDFTKVEMKTTDLGHRTYMIEGAGGNITVAAGDDGVIMVDGEFAPLHDKIKAAVEAVSKGPIRYLINTHYHGDHTGGNEGFAKDGATVAAHINVRNRLAAGTTNGLTGAKTPPAAAGALPTKTYTKTLTLKVKGRASRD